MLPSMPEAQWKAYIAWVASFGTGNNGRKVKRQMDKLRRRPNVTVTATERMTEEIAKAVQIIHAHKAKASKSQTLILMRAEADAVVTIDHLEPAKSEVRLIPRRATRR